MKIDTFIFLFLERQQSISTPPIELVSNPLEINENDVQQTELQPITVGIKEEEQKKLIQKETVETGSVSSNLFFYVIIRLN
jgi:hypothetical protein